MVSGHVTMLAVMCDKMHGIMLTKGVYLSLGVQSISWVHYIGVMD